MLKAERKYPDPVMHHALYMGFKAANLLYLQDLIGTFSKAYPDGTPVVVPPIVCLSDQHIKKYLDQFVPTWRSHWEHFVTQFQADRTLSGEASIVLKRLQDDIETHLSQMPIDFPLVAENRVMIRSTGREDATDLMNPGGNASFPADPSNLAAAIAGVVSSYFSEKSLGQRLLAGDDITQEPFTPVLIQALVGEALDTEKQGPVSSGVMYSDGKKAYIQAAFGHGELVVNSKGHFDSFYISDNAVIYAEKQAKHQRIRVGTSLDPHTGRLRMETVPNPVSIQYAWSLDEPHIHRLHALAQCIEAQYGMPMDSEFVYDWGKNTLYIVQTRPLPGRNRYNVPPAALQPALLRQAESLSGSTITPALKTAVVIENPQAVILAETIGQALDQYLSHPEYAGVKAVVIKEKAPSTSHEACQFTAQAIPVIQVDDFAQAQHWFNNTTSRVLVVDPQHKSIFQLSMAYQDQPVLAEGLCGSALPLETSLYPQAYLVSQPQPLYQPMATEAVRGKLGTWLFQAKSADPGVAVPAQTALFSFLYQQIEGIKRYPDLNRIRLAWDQLVHPERGQLAAHIQTVRRLLSTLVHLGAQRLITRELLTQMLINGADLIVLLETLDQSEHADCSHDPLYSGYLDVYAKLKGLIFPEIAPTPILYNTLNKDLSAYKMHQKWDHLLDKQGFSEEQRVIFYAAIQLKGMFFKQEKAHAWETFCMAVCGNIFHARLLAHLARQVINNHISEQWCNITVAPLMHAEEKETHAEKSARLLVHLDQDFFAQQEKIQAIQKIAQITRVLANQTSLWEAPEKFDSLYQNLEPQLDYVLNHIDLDDADPVMLKMCKANTLHELVHALDLSIKTLITSDKYPGDAWNQDKKAKNFQTLLNQLFKVFVFLCQKTNIQERVSFKIIHPMLQNFFSSPYKVSAKDLELSKAINLDDINLNNFLVYYDWLSDICKKVITLHDAFTVIHQNLIDIIRKKILRQEKETIKNILPDEKIELINILENFNLKLHNDTYIKKITPAHFINGFFDHEKITLQYNLPLREHSVIFYLTYNIRNNKFFMKIIAFGDNEYGRFSLSFSMLEELLLEKYPVGKVDYRIEKCSSFIEMDITRFKSIDFYNFLTHVWKILIGYSLEDNVWNSDIEEISVFLKNKFSKNFYYTKHHAFSIPLCFGVKLSEINDLETEQLERVLLYYLAKSFGCELDKKIINNLDRYIIQILLTHEASKLYMKGLNIHELIGLSKQKITFSLRSPAILDLDPELSGLAELCPDPKLRVKYLEACSAEEINALFLWYSLKNTWEGDHSFKELIGIDLYKEIALLYNAHFFMKTPVEIFDLKDFETDKIRFLICPSMMRCFWSGYTVSLFNDLSPEETRVLALWHTKKHDNKKLQITDIDWSDEEFRLLSSYNAMAAYEMDLKQQKCLKKTEFLPLYHGQIKGKGLNTVSRKNVHVIR